MSEAFLTERSVEIPWILDRAIGARNVLDIGAAGSKYLAALSQVAFNVTAIDTRNFTVPYGVAGYVMDAAELPADWSGKFDLIVCLSVLDHVGVDAYGNEQEDGKLVKVVEEMRRVLEPQGRALITAPVGKPQLTTHPGGGQRVFSHRKMVELFDEWLINSVSYYRLNGGLYEPVAKNEIEDADYLGLRAEACGCWEFVRL